MEIAIAFLLLLLFGSKKKQAKPIHNNDQTPPGNSNGSTQLFKSQFYTWLAGKEGGLNNVYAGGDKPTDEAPCSVPGMSPNPHTSAGVKYATYQSLTPILHLPGTCADFIAMSGEPKNTSWYKIVDHYIDLGLAYSPNLVLGSYIGLWKWGGWKQEIVSPTQVLAIAQDNSLTLQNKLRQLVDLRKYYFDQLAIKNGYGQSLVDAWKARADNFYNTFNSFLT